MFKPTVLVGCWSFILSRGWRYAPAGGFRCRLTFEVRRDQRQDAKPGLVKMYRVPPARAWWPAVGPRLERRLGLIAQVRGEELQYSRPIRRWIVGIQIHVRGPLNRP